MNNKTITLLYTPFTGLGLFQGFRGNRWLKNRIQIFKQFTLSSLLAQTNRDFIHWISWRREEKRNPLVKELENYLGRIEGYRFIFTYSGLCFYDDKYPDEVARDRLLTNLHGSIGELLDTIGECDYIQMVLTPSDDCYHKNAVMGIQSIFRENPNLQAVGFSKGYIMNYLTKEVADYNPKTNPPFYTIKFPRDIFIDPLKHVLYCSLKHDIEEKNKKIKYKKGSVLPSHEYLSDVFGSKYGIVNERAFLVGVHSENISTSFSHPFKGDVVGEEVLKDFGLYDVPVLKLKLSLRKWLLRKLPHKVQRKIRYIFGECLWNRFYNWIRE